MAAPPAPSLLAVDEWYRWAYGVLQGIGAPTTQTNIQTLWKWSVKESGSNPMRWNNPLNTTQRLAGSVSKNSVGVQAFPDTSSGILATTQTLTNGRYPAIITALRNSTPASMWVGNPAITSQLGTWGSGTNWLNWNNSPPKASINFQYSTTGSSNNTVGGNPISDALAGALGPIGSAITGAEQNFVSTLTNVLLMIMGGVIMLAGVGVLVYAMTGFNTLNAASNLTPVGRAATVAKAVTKTPATAPAKPQLSGAAQEALSEARAGRGRKLSPEVKSELRGSQAGDLSPRAIAERRALRRAS